MTPSGISALNAKLTLKEYERTKATISASDPSFAASSSYIIYPLLQIYIIDGSLRYSCFSKRRQTASNNKKCEVGSCRQNVYEQMGGGTDGSDIGMRLLAK
ncbi:hypothetical protein T11_951 [Trichinella zimbabwensis]|uniref:Uncharacterized protein n=1 Tax=Trichinella zimbabwensis TaxID=268475 RepID=A0A0V1H166_9BILA|nr:hypothetical protein T11_951 [Trichinella zimbabwensis]